MAGLEKLIGTIAEAFSKIAGEVNDNEPKHIVQKVFAGTVLYRVTTDNAVVPFRPIGVAVEKDGKKCKIYFLDASDQLIGAAPQSTGVPAENVFQTPMEAYVDLLNKLNVYDIVPDHLAYKPYEEAK
jgi:hypothetical protein